MKTLKLWLWGLFLAFIMSTQALAGAWTANEFVYKPGLGARGAEEKARFDSGAERVDARLSKEIWVGDPKFGSTLQAAVTAIGSSQVVLRVPVGTHNISADLTIPTTLTLKPERGAVLAIATTKTLTINGTLEAGLYQIFSLAGTGKVVFGSGAVTAIKTTWFGDNAAGITAALAAVPITGGKARPTLVQMPGKDIILESAITVNNYGTILEGTGGTCFAAQDPFAGTRLIWEGSGPALIVGSAFTSGVRLKNFCLDGNNVGEIGLQVGVDATTNYPINMLVENILISKFVTTGIDYRTCEYSNFHLVQSSYNRGPTGAAGSGVGTGMTCSIGYSAAVKWDTCSFSYNGAEGVLITPNTATTNNFNDGTFDNCDFQGNGYEGFKASSTNHERGVDNLTIAKSWFEGNQLASARAGGGYYSLLLSGGSVDRIGTVTLRENNFRGVTAQLGSDSVTNGTFAADSDWTKGANWTIGSGVATHAAGATAVLEQTLAISADTLYRVSYQVSSRTAGFITPSLGGRSGPTVYANNYYTCTIYTADTANLKFTPTSDFDGSIDNVVVKKVLNRTLYANGVNRLICKGNAFVKGDYNWGGNDSAYPRCVYGPVSDSGIYGQLNTDDPVRLWEWNDAVEVTSPIMGDREVVAVTATGSVTNRILQVINIPKRTWSIGYATRTADPMAMTGGGNASSVRIVAQGTKTVADAKTIYLMFGSQTIATLSSSTADSWSIEATITYKWNSGSGVGSWEYVSVTRDGTALNSIAGSFGTINGYDNIPVQIKTTVGTESSTVVCRVLRYERF